MKEECTLAVFQDLRFSGLDNSCRSRISRLDLSQQRHVDARQWVRFRLARTVEEVVPKLFEILPALIIGHSPNPDGKDHASVHRL